jgi:hypothetical protein
MRPLSSPRLQSKTHKLRPAQLVRQAQRELPSRNRLIKAQPQHLHHSSPLCPANGKQASMRDLSLCKPAGFSPSSARLLLVNVYAKPTIGTLLVRDGLGCSIRPFHNSSDATAGQCCLGGYKAPPPGRLRGFRPEIHSQPVSAAAWHTTTSLRMRRRNPRRWVRLQHWIVGKVTRFGTTD